MADFDVLIVGAGPVGSRVACTLAESGYKVGVVEKGKRVGEQVCCTGIISRECAELFDIDANCILWEAPSAKVFAPSGASLRISKDDVQAYIVDRAAFDFSFAERALSKGAEYVLNSRVRDISLSGDGVMLHIEGENGERTLEGRAAVIANGFGSTLPGKLELGSIQEFMVGAQTEVQTAGVDEVEVYFSHSIAPGFFAWLAPVAPNRARVGLFAHRKSGPHMKAFLAELASQGRIQDSGGTVAYGGIPLKPLARTYADRVLVVGDAAGQVKPTTGGGVYFGLLCADIASEVLGEALAAGDLSASRLSRYEKLWKEKLGRELKIEYVLRKLYNKLSDKQIESIFSVAKKKRIHRSLLDSPYLSFDWHGELLLEGLRRAGFWHDVIKTYIPAGVWAYLRSFNSPKSPLTKGGLMKE
ncbi:MAG: geranylgeranyl reductase family protein [Chloroflexota bacterium]